MYVTEFDEPHVLNLAFLKNLKQNTVVAHFKNITCIEMFTLTTANVFSIHPMLLGSFGFDFCGRAP